MNFKQNTAVVFQKEQFSTSTYVMLLYFYCPQRSCEGYVFTGVCLSTGGVGVSVSVHAGIPHPPRSRPPLGADTPPNPQSRHTPSRHPPRRHPKSRHPPGADIPRSRHPPEADIPQSRHPPKQTPPGADPPSRHPPADTPPGADPTPPERRPLLRTVRILLESILVSKRQHLFFSSSANKYVKFAHKAWIYLPQWQSIRHQVYFQSRDLLR